MFSSDVLMMFAEGIRDTLYMTLVSTAFAYLLGLPIAILLVVTGKMACIRCRRFLVFLILLLIYCVPYRF